jgi:uncharacterized protein DUF6916
MTEQPITEQLTPDRLTPEHFQAHVAKTFRVRGGRHGLTLTEVQVPALPESQLNILPRQPFSLIFKSPPAELLPEGFYTFEVEGAPAFAFYVMPIHTPARDRQDYQAVFN